MRGGWNEIEKWCLDKLTLNGNLPLDIIEAVEVCKIVSEKKKNSILEVAGTRYYKIDKDSSSTFPTRLVSKGGVYSYNNDTLENNALLLQKAGFLEHENCIPYLAMTEGTKASKADAELRKVDVLDVNVLPRVQKGKKELAIRLKEQLVSQVKEIEERRKPLLRKLRQKNKEVSRMMDAHS